MTYDYNLASWYVYALTGSVDTPMHWRCIHDVRKDLAGHNYRGTLAECWNTLCDYNSRGYGIFASINAMDDLGQELQNVKFIRTHVIDLDSPTAPADYQRAVAWGGSFAVQSSPDKFHVYFPIQPYTGNEFYTTQQRKLNQLFNADKKIIDATRVMRVPGFFHLKNEPVLVSGWQLPSWGKLLTTEGLQSALSYINVVEHFSTRKPLGEPEMQAPSLDWLKFALNETDPNNMDRNEWLSLSAAFKQAGWTLADEPTLYNIWNEWCNRYNQGQGNDLGENLKLWNSINNTETGWATFERRTPVKAWMQFGNAPPPEIPKMNVQQPQTQPQPQVITPMMLTPEQALQQSNQKPVQTNPIVGQQLDPRNFRDILGESDCKEWFKNCYFVNRTGQIFSSSGRFMNATQFNGEKGGKLFIITTDGKVTDEPWKAALRSTVWTIPKVDHVRFLPDKPTFEIIIDSLGRRGLNTYIPAIIDSKEGDLTLWFDWFDRILPDKNDQRILFEYLAHCVKFPGYKIPWSPMLQSTEGIGKTIFREILSHSLGTNYVYGPKAPELVKSGSTFNGWMRGKLMIIVDEIKIDERRELIEILKPMITDNVVEIQSKGVDQDMEDNPANWLFFSNWPDAIPINRNGRRYAIFYSAIQNKKDMDAAGMDDVFFTRLWTWLRDGGGKQAIAHWLLNYPIERGSIPARAPETSSYVEALRNSRSPMEVTVDECVEDNVQGFRGGFVSSIALVKKAKEQGLRNVTSRSVQSCLEGMGYMYLGRSPRSYMQENPTTRSEVYGKGAGLRLEDFGLVQGYDV